MRTVILLLVLLPACRDKGTLDDSSVPGDSNNLNDTGEPAVVDVDGDGVEAGEDCNDADASVFPGAEELCDGVDNDCDGDTDEDDATDATTWYIDYDGDGHGSDAFTMEACNQPDDWVDNAEDCDDSDADFYPGAPEDDCTDPLDYNCDGSTGYTDADGDGFAACEDCDDSEPDVHQESAEICDGLDNDCNGFIDEADPGLSDGTTYYGDADGDGYGGSQFTTSACDLPSGYTATSDDCDDTDASTHPGASESCDEKDNDCDGSIDEGVQLTWYADADQDGFGDSTQTTDTCTAPQGYVSNGNDCDDANPQVSPSAYEICDGTDNDCDGSIDEDALNPSTWYVDSDGDGHGDASDSTLACSQPSGYAADTIDCDDSDAASTTTATDADCDGAITAEDCDDNDATSNTTATDGDCDGTLTADDCNDTDATSTTVATDADCDGTITADDCNDNDNTSNTTATDADCDGTLTADDCNDSDNTSTTAATDADCDGTLTADDCDDSDASSSTVATDADCDGTLTADDCNDNDASIGSGVAEVCDGVDNNCDGEIDEGILGTPSCYADSCLDLATNAPTSADGLYWIQPLSTPLEVYCDITAGGWTMVYLATNTAGVTENGSVGGGSAIGATPFTPSSTGHYKLEDGQINTLRSGSVANDLKVVIRINGTELGSSWHPSTCTLQSGSWLSAGDNCNASTTAGPNDTNRTQSGHAGTLTRWYVDSSFGYIWPSTHIGPISGGTSHGGSLPPTYCTYYDGRHCPQNSQFEVWAY